jgi:hypothetical protein
VPQERVVSVTMLVSSMVAWLHRSDDELAA